MTKKEFIQLVIRFLGIALLISSFRAIIRICGMSIVVCYLMPVSSTSEILTLWAMINKLISPSIDIAAVIYLLFFGKLIFNTVNRTSDLELENSLQKANYVEILIRFLGVWWTWRIICQIFALISSSIQTWLLLHPEWLLSNVSISDDPSPEVIEKLGEFLQPLHQSMFWSRLINILIFTVLAYYFLRKGKFFINLLTNRWLDQNSLDVQNDMASARVK